MLLCCLKVARSILEYSSPNGKEHKWCLLLDEKRICSHINLAFLCTTTAMKQQQQQWCAIIGAKRAYKTNGVSPTTTKKQTSNLIINVTSAVVIKTKTVSTVFCFKRDKAKGQLIMK